MISVIASRTGACGTPFASLRVCETPAGRKREACMRTPRTHCHWTERTQRKISVDIEPRTFSFTACSSLVSGRDESDREECRLDCGQRRNRKLWLDLQGSGLWST